MAEQEKAQGGKRSALDYVELQKRLSDFKFETCAPSFLPSFTLLLLPPT